MRSTVAARGVLWAFASASMSAAFILPWKLASTLGEPSTLVLIMLLGAGTINLGVLRLQDAARAPRLNRTTLVLGFGLALLTLAGNLASAEAIRRISGPLLSVLQRAEVIVVALLAWALVGERVDRRFWAGALVALCGFWLVRGNDVDRVTSDGLLYGLTSAVCFSTMAVLTRKYITEVEPASLNALRVWISVPLWFLIYGAPPALETLSVELVLYAGLAGMLGPGLSRLFLMQSARHVPARISSLVTLATPVLTLVLSWALLDSWPSARELWGGSVMLLGIGLPVVATLRSAAAAR
jgi:drug/metabolite transporter (DMT)-like permease